MANIEKLGSSSPEVLLKNATNLDKLVNGRESESLPGRPSKSQAVIGILLIRLF
ncbi:MULTISPECIES: hypothetical protein [Klebsiella pneumoniae complex]|uniref:hypothetical protein n=1 Tax=Klebsiella pneumoniae complex TaxID=3390273 RepID=UPI00044863DF|nr:MULTISPECIES: hypothetical protein [Klebsiella]MCC5686344.1 hypothetical protein [Klebsiella pneumoniae]OWG20994.1 hypothetical protein L472_001415 [Klebsiella pneumoniae BIDMC 35]SXD52886.1 Uncharacterised protein [Klebsiella quasipneumoniae]